MIHEATRTLVKSQPEVWAQCSDGESLAKHLNGSFGEIRITRLEPETTVAWEGENASGTVKIEPSNWGTRVTLTAEVEDQAEAEPAPEAGPELNTTEPEAVVEPVAAQPEAVAEQEAVAEPEMVAEPEAVAPPEPGPSVPPPALANEQPAFDPPAARMDARGSFFARLTARFWRHPAVEARQPRPEAPEPYPPAPEEPQSAAVVPEPVPETHHPAAEAPEPEPAVGEPEEELTGPSLGPAADEPVRAPSPATPTPDAAAALTAGLDSLGQAHHRPFSRA